ncbi:MAG: LLM class flavin-dependent oxidoreductase [Chloroflexi bacterium]|nr:LLM class flavin-dependent oxidoreductase [Chloroflexota bacterium]
MSTANGVQMGVAIPQVFLDGPIDMALVGSWIRKAEDLGFDSLWVQEGIVGNFRSLEPVSLLSYAAALTAKVRLGTSVMLAPLRNPVQLAKSLGSLDQLSQGRLTVGLGLGGRLSDYATFGISPEKRVRRFVEVLEVMKRLWVEPEAHYQGTFWQLDGISMEPKPVQKPHPPIWFGGGHPRALKRAVRHGDGWMGAGSSSTAQFREAVNHLQTFLEEAGRDPSSFPISKRVYIAIDDDEARAEKRLREWFGGRYNNAERASEVGVWGSVSHCIEQLAEVVAAGAGMLMINPVFDHMDHLELLSQEVAPNL